MFCHIGLATFISLKILSNVIGYQNISEFTYQCNTKHKRHTAVLFMIKVLGKGSACIPEDLTKACGTHGPTKGVYVNFTKHV